MPAGLEVKEGEILAIAGLSVDDADGDELTVTLTFSDGVIALAQEDGLVVDHSVPGQILLSGSIANINAALDGMTFTPDALFSGQVVIAVTADDGALDASGDFTITVNEDQPPSLVLTPPTASLVVPEDGVGALSFLSVQDPDDDVVTVHLSVDFGTLSLGAFDTGLLADFDSVQGSGTIVDNGGILAYEADQPSTMTLSGSIAQVNAALQELTYTGFQDFNGADVLQVSLSDAKRLDLGLPETFTVGISVTPVNDAPVFAPPGGAERPSADEGGSVTLTLAQFGLTDIDNTDEQLILRFEGEDGDLRGGFYLNGFRILAGATFSAQAVTEGRLEYRHDGSQVLVADTVVVGLFSVQDGAGGSAGVAALGTGPAVPLEILLQPVNDPPTVGGGSTVFEGQADVPIEITVVDPDDAAPFRLEILNLPEDGILHWDGVAIEAGDLPYVIEAFDPVADAGRLTFSHDGNDANFGRPPSVSFDIRVTDGGGGQGLDAAASAEQTITIVVLPANDDPELTAGGVPVALTGGPDDGQIAGLDLDPANGAGWNIHVLTDADLLVTDPDSGMPQLVYRIVDLPDPDLGTLQLQINGTWYVLEQGFGFSQVDVNEGRVRYVFHGAIDEALADGFSFQVFDGDLTFNDIDDTGLGVREGGIRTFADDGYQVFTFGIGIAAWEADDPLPPGWEDDGGTGPGSPGEPGDPVDDPDAPPPPDAPPLADLFGTPTLSNNITLQVLEGEDGSILGGLDPDIEYLGAEAGQLPPAQIVYRLTELPEFGDLVFDDGEDSYILGLYASFTQADLDAGLDRKSVV